VLRVAVSCQTIAPGSSLAPFIAKFFTAFEKVKALAALAFSEASRRGELEIDGGSTSATSAKNLLDRAIPAVV